MPETTSQPAVETLEEIASKITRRWGSQYRTQLNAAILSALRNERERAAKLAENPYGDEVEALAGDEPKAVGEKIAAAIREGQCNE